MLSVPPATGATGIICQTLFGAATNQVNSRGRLDSLQVALPLLAGPQDECLLSEAEHTFARYDFTLFSQGDMLAGFSLARPDLNLEEATTDLYQRLFAVCGQRHLYRIWNYVPGINAQANGLENYRHFCRGRSLSFENHFGRDFHRVLPAASAVGCAHGPLALCFLAGPAKPTHFENPRQVPAFEYPLQYGPRPPSFARATAYSSEAARRIFISGTAAIIGHQSVAGGDLASQIDCTLENLRLIGTNAGLGPRLGADHGWSRSFKVYIRHAADFKSIAAHLSRELLQTGDSVQYLQADICRADLLVEIEALLSSSPA